MANANLSITEFRDYYSGALIDDRTRDSVTSAATPALETVALDTAAEIVLGRLRRAYGSGVLGGAAYPVSVGRVMDTYVFHALWGRTGSLNSGIVSDFEQAQAQVERWSNKVEPILGLTPNVMIPASNKSTSEQKMTWDPTSTDANTRGTLDEIVTFPPTGTGKPT